jgi:hypothetical protein
LPLIVPTEPTQASDAVPVATMETEVDRLKRYLEVSQATLEVVEQEMQTVLD